MGEIDLKNCTFTIKDGSVVQESIDIKIGEGNLTWSQKRNMDYMLDRGNLDSVRQGDQVPVEIAFDFVWEYIKGTRWTGATGITTTEIGVATDTEINVTTTGTAIPVGTKFKIVGESQILTAGTCTVTNLVFTPALVTGCANGAAVSFFGTPSIEDALSQQGEAAGWNSTSTDTCEPFSVDLEITNIPAVACGDKETMTFSDFRWESLDHDFKTGQISCTGKCNIVAPTVVRAANT